MKCKYRFKVEGKIKPSVICPITVRGWTYEFHVNDDGVITHISVTVNSIDEVYWPKITESNAPGVKLDINIPDAAFAFVKMELRVIEGLLSLFGMKKIDYEHAEIEWIPESENEKKSLPMSRFKVNKSDIPDSELSPLSFDLIARSVIGANLGYENEVALSFYRKGRIDVDEQRYIEAIYDYYFLFESVFGQGQFKKVKAVEAFLSSGEFVSIIQQALDDPGLIIFGDKKLLAEFNRTYKAMSVKAAVTKIVELRGFLHHHTLKRKDIWHPEDHNAYELDALFFQNVAFGVAFNLFGECVFNSEVISKYQSMFLRKTGL